MKTLLLVACLAVPVVAQAPDPITIADLVDAYKGQVAEARGATRARLDAMLKTPEGLAYSAAKAHEDDVAKRLATRLKDRTGKTIDWQTGALGDAPATDTQ